MTELRITAEAIKNPALREQIVHRADEEFPFLHDTMVASLGGRLLMAWYNCSEDEIVGRTVIRGCWSSDGGKTWSKPEIICEDTENGLHMVPVTFTEKDGEIWAYVTQMSAHDRPTGYVCVQYVDHEWRIREEREDLVLLNTLPQSVGAKWVVGGRRAAKAGELPHIPVIALAEKENPARWEIVDLPGPWEQGEYPLFYPETAVLVDGANVTAISRNDAGAAQFFESTDGGRSWSTGKNCDMPIAPAKIYAGSLPDGRQYMIYNEITPEKDRSKLVMALRDGSGKPFDRAWILAEGFNEALDAGPYWHYPCACVADGWLHISCTVSARTVVRHAAMFSLPLESI